MHQVSHRLVAIICLGWFASGAGCLQGGRDFEPRIPVAGSWYHYDSDDGGELRLTFQGLEEHQGSQWLRFKSEGFVGLDIGSIGWVERQTGGRPFSEETHQTAAASTPFMEWHRDQGHYQERVGYLLFYINITDEDHVRLVELDSWIVEGRTTGRHARTEVIAYAQGDILPRQYYVKSYGGNGSVSGESSIALREKHVM
jgi:hypothetical protein